MILERDLSGERLAREVKELMADPEAIGAMEEASRRLARSDAAERCVDLAIDLSRG